MVNSCRRFGKKNLSASTFRIELFWKDLGPLELVWSKVLADTYRRFGCTVVQYVANLLSSRHSIISQRVRAFSSTAVRIANVAVQSTSVWQCNVHSNMPTGLQYATEVQRLLILDPPGKCHYTMYVPEVIRPVSFEVVLLLLLLLLLPLLLLLLLLLLPGAELPSWKFWPSQWPLSTSLDPGRRLSSFWSSFGRCPVWCYPPIFTWVFLVIFWLEVSN